MQVCKWGNGLAVMLPSSVVETLGLRDGDDVMVDIAGRRESRHPNADSRQHALRRLKTLNWTLPAGFVFSRRETAGDI